MVKIDNRYSCCPHKFTNQGPCTEVYHTVGWEAEDAKRGRMGAKQIDLSSEASSAMATMEYVTNSSMILEIISVRTSKSRSRSQLW